jgi:hypothetical protein
LNRRNERNGRMIFDRKPIDSRFSHNSCFERVCRVPPAGLKIGRLKQEKREKREKLLKKQNRTPVPPVSPV